MDSRSRLAGAALVAISAVAFSGKAIIIKLAYRHGVDAVTLLTLRMLLSAPFFFALAWWAGRGADAGALSTNDRFAVVGLGLIGYYLSSLFDFLGLQHITAALERLVLFLYPTFVVLLACALRGRKIGRTDIVALILSYAGISLVVVNDFATQPGNVALGVMWVLASAICYAVYLFGSGHLVGRLGSLRFACLAGLVSCAGVVVHFLVTRDASLLWRQPIEVHGLSLLMALVSTVLPIVLMSEGIRRLGSSHASMVSSIGPVATILLGFWFLDEAITAIQILGALLVLAGVLAISLGKKQD